MVPSFCTGSFPRAPVLRGPKLTPFLTAAAPVVLPLPRPRLRSRGLLSDAWAFAWACDNVGLFAIDAFL